MVIQYLQVVGLTQQKAELIVESFCKNLRQHSMKIINYKKKKNVYH